MCLYYYELFFHLTLTKYILSTKGFILLLVEAPLPISSRGCKNLHQLYIHSVNMDPSFVVNNFSVFQIAIDPFIFKIIHTRKTHATPKVSNIEQVVAISYHL
jgi:hypothetical protein